MKKKNILLISDNEKLLYDFRFLLKKLNLDRSPKYKFDYGYSFRNKLLVEKFKNDKWIKSINVKEDVFLLCSNYNLIFSLHCKQIFPAELVKNVLCINIHPGLNPHNRGWFPQVFSIINGLPCGATIHEIDEKLDHGPIIIQREVKINSWDTSYSVYNKVLELEIELLSESLRDILELNYKTISPKEGNINLKKDFDELCKLDLDEKDTFRNHINKLRALTHGDYSNAFFIDDLGNKVHIKIELSKK